MVVLNYLDVVLLQSQLNYIGKLEQTISVFFKSFDCYEVQRRAFKHLIFSLKNFKHKKTTRVDMNDICKIETNFVPLSHTTCKYTQKCVCFKVYNVVNFESVVLRMFL